MLFVLAVSKTYGASLACRRIFPPNTRPIINNGSIKDTRASEPDTPKPGQTLRTDYYKWYPFDIQHCYQPLLNI